MEGERTDGGRGREQSRVSVCLARRAEGTLARGGDTAGPGLTWGCGRLVTEESGLAARDGQKLCVLRGLWQRLGAGGQECVEVLQPSDLGAGSIATRAGTGRQSEMRAHTTPCRTRGKGRTRGYQLGAVKTPRTPGA